MVFSGDFMEDQNIFKITFRRVLLSPLYDYEDTLPLKSSRFLEQNRRLRGMMKLLKKSSKVDLSTVELGHI